MLGISIFLNEKNWRKNNLFRYKDFIKIVTIEWTEKLSIEIEIIIYVFWRIVRWPERICTWTIKKEHFSRLSGLRSWKEGSGRLFHSFSLNGKASGREISRPLRWECLLA